MATPHATGLGQVHILGNIVEKDEIVRNDSLGGVPAPDHVHVFPARCAVIAHL
jgi:hypothetical protein